MVAKERKHQYESDLVNIGTIKTVDRSLTVGNMGPRRGEPVFGKTLRNIHEFDGLGLESWIDLSDDTVLDDPILR